MGVNFFQLKCFSPQLVAFAGKTKEHLKFIALILYGRKKNNEKPLRPNLVKIEKKQTVPINFESPMTN